MDLSVILPWCATAIAVGAAFAARSRAVEIAEAAAFARALGGRFEVVEEMATNLDARWAAEKLELQNLVENLEQLSETVERKRRRAAASASKANGQEPELSGRDALIRRARELGHSV